MVRCSECGFLALRNIETRNLDEAEEEFRKLGRLSEYSKFHPVKEFDTPFYKDEELTRYVHEDLPVCFAKICDFGILCTQATTATSTYSEDILSVINTKRPCESFTKWHRGFTPKEHQEMIDREAMMRWQSQREDADRKWMTRQQWFMVIVAGIFTVLGGIIALVITLIVNR
jgi:hypothetical protein